NIGLRVGPESNLAVLDLDRRHGGDLAALGFELPGTLTVSTGDGEHRYFEFPEELVGLPAIVTLAPGLELKLDGYVVTSPSVHPSGAKYTTLGDHDVMPMPPELVDLALSKALAPGGAARATEVPETIAAGNRNTVLVSIAGSMRRRGL